MSLTSLPTVEAEKVVFVTGQQVLLINQLQTARTSNTDGCENLHICLILGGNIPVIGTSYHEDQQTGRDMAYASAQVSKSQIEAILPKRKQRNTRALRME